MYDRDFFGFSILINVLMLVFSSCDMWEVGWAVWYIAVLIRLTILMRRISRGFLISHLILRVPACVLSYRLTCLELGTLGGAKVGDMERERRMRSRGVEWVKLNGLGLEQGGTIMLLALCT